MKLRALTCIQIILAIGVVVAIFTMNATVLIGVVVLAVVVGVLYWCKNKQKLATVTTTRVPQQLPNRINTINNRDQNSTKQIDQDDQDQDDQDVNQDQESPISYEPLSTRVSRVIAAKNMFNNLPEPPNARFNALKSAYKSGGQAAIGLKSVAHMQNIRQVV